MKNKKIIFVSIGIILFIIILIIIWSIINSEKEVVNNVTEIIPAEEITDEQLRSTAINLYYINKDTGEIEQESRIIDSKKLLENPYLEIMNLWKEGAQKNNLVTGVSKELKINNIEISNNCAVVDLSEQFLLKENEEINELKIVYCIVNSLTELTEIDSVKILINGEENIYFGNINLSEQYYKLVE